MAQRLLSASCLVIIVALGTTTMGKASCVIFCKLCRFWNHLPVKRRNDPRAGSQLLPTKLKMIVHVFGTAQNQSINQSAQKAAEEILLVAACYYWSCTVNAWLINAWKEWWNLHRILQDNLIKNILLIRRTSDNFEGYNHFTDNESYTYDQLY